MAARDSATMLRRDVRHALRFPIMTISGMSVPLDFLFINVDLTVVLPRDPSGEWLLLDAVTTIGGNGTGLTETTLSDVQGPCGTALQTLLVAPR
jgi:Thioesterase-like superfamily